MIIPIKIPFIIVSTSSCNSKASRDRREPRFYTEEARRDNRMNDKPRTTFLPGNQRAASDKTRKNNFQNVTLIGSSIRNENFQFQLFCRKVDDIDMTKLIHSKTQKFFNRKINN